MKELIYLAVLGSCVLSCGDQPDVQRTELAANALGVRAIEVTHGQDLFVLRGLDASGSEIASVSRRIGEIEDLPVIYDRIGSELVLSFAGDEHRLITRDVDHMFIPARDPAMQSFLQLDAVTTALAHEGIQITRPAAANDETAYLTQQCPGPYLNTTPVADQCCYTSGAQYDPNSTYFVAASGVNAGKVVFRERGTYGNCKGVNGESCNGAACFWGPNGFARPSLETGSNPRIENVSGGGTGRLNKDYCQPYWYASNPPPTQFGNVTGTFAPGQGCPGSDGGGGVQNGVSVWDY